MFKTNIEIKLGKNMPYQIFHKLCMFLLIKTKTYHTLIYIQKSLSVSQRLTYSSNKKIPDVYGRTAFPQKY